MALKNMALHRRQSEDPKTHARAWEKSKNLLWQKTIWPVAYFQEYVTQFKNLSSLWHCSQQDLTYGDQ